MKITPLNSGRGAKSLCAVALLLSACSNDREVRRADEAYQQAVARDDVYGQRMALLALTQAEDGVSEYWLRLANLELAMGAFADAYAHLSRAHELDRTAVPPLSLMTELAVISGRLDMAEQHLKQLLVIAPEDRAVALARGFIALRQADYPKAQENVDLLLARNQRDSIANVLQTRILIYQRKFPEAIEMLDRKLALSPEDRALLKSAGAIHRYLGDWGKAAAFDLRLWRLTPTDATLARQLIREALLAENMPLAKRVTESVMKSAKTVNEVDAILSEWSNPAHRAALQSMTIGSALPDHSRVAFAHHLNRAGRPDRAISILGGRVRPVEERANATFNAVLAESLRMKGQARQARQILDQILRTEPDNPFALSARALILSRSGNHREATIDAQRLVTSYGVVPDHRVLLANIYRASGDPRGAERTLWDAHRDLPGEEMLHEEVRRILNARGDRDALLRFETDYKEEKFSRLKKELA